MSNAKVVMGQAANTLVKPLNVEDVFSTYLFSANGGTQTITNGIDLAGEGGAVWLKARTQTYSHTIYDTDRGVGASIFPNLSNAETTGSGRLTSFNSDGFEVGSSENSNFNVPTDSVSWTFRKAPKFFDAQTWTGNGTAGRTISHNLGTTVGCVMIKNTSNAENWMVYHIGSGIDGQLNLNSTAAATDDSSQFNDTVPSSTVLTLGSNAEVNANGQTYVAYLFAHNDGDGEFGADGDADIIKCGSFTTNASFDASIDLGFEPQWVMIKKVDAAGSWFIIDSMRGFTSGGNEQWLLANGNNSEGSTEFGYLTATGFEITDNFGTNSEHIYIAIRRGTKVPESASEVFAMDVGDSDGDSSTPEFVSGFPVDAGLVKQTNGTGQFFLLNRLNQGATLYTDSNQAENTSGVFAFDYSDGFYGGSRNADYQAWMWKRAPGFCDAVAYTGDGVAGRTVSHNLTVAPEMMWVKTRSSTYSWAVYHKDIGATKYLNLSATDAAATRVFNWNDTEPTASDFTVGSGYEVNRSSFSYIAYLFASLPGISKVGSYTGDGTTDGSKVIDCGFTSGARFVLIKSADAIGNWNVFDTTRGIIVGNDALLRLNNTSAEVSTDQIDPHPSGFKMSSGSSTIVNISGVSYIFYAIA